MASNAHGAHTCLLFKLLRVHEADSIDVRCTVEVLESKMAYVL